MKAKAIHSLEMSTPSLEQKLYDALKRICRQYDSVANIRKKAETHRQNIEILKALREIQDFVPKGSYLSVRRKLRKIVTPLITTLEQIPPPTHNAFVKPGCELFNTNQK